MEKSEFHYNVERITSEHWYPVTIKVILLSLLGIYVLPFLKSVMYDNEVNI